MIKKIFKKVLLVQVLLCFMGILGMLVDGVVIGRFLGGTAMAAYGLSSAVLTVLAAVGGVFASGAQMVCADSIGKGDEKEAKSRFSALFIISSAASIVLCFALIFFASKISILLGAPEGGTLFFQTKEYLIGYVIGAPGYIMMHMLFPLVQLDGDDKKPAIAGFVMMASDIVLDFVNVFWLDGGMFGMGLASSISYYLAFGVLLMHFARKNAIFTPSLKSANFSCVGSAINNGLPYAMQQIWKTIQMVIINRMLVAALGEISVTAFSVSNSVGNVVCAILNGLGGATLMLAGVMYGEENRSGLKDTVQSFFAWSAILSIPISLLMVIWPNFFVALFLEPDEAAYSLACTALRIFAISLPFYALNCSYRNYVQGVGHLLISQIISFCQNFIFAVIPAFVMIRMADARSIVWYFLPVKETATLATIFFTAYICSKIRKNRKNILLFVSDDFSVPEEAILKITSKERDYGLIQREAISFFEKYQASENMKNSFVDAIRVLSSGCEKATWEVQLFSKNDEWVFRMRSSSGTGKIHDDGAFASFVGSAKNLSHLSSFDTDELIARFDR